MRIQQQGKIQVQQPAAQILQGPEHRDDGYQMREEWGLPMNDASYANSKSLEQQYAANANQYKQAATSSLQSSIGSAKSNLAGISAPSIPGFQEPASTTIWAGGDGDKPQKYTLPSSAVPEILKGFQSTNYYSVSSNADGSYGISFKDRGKEGYEALNKAQQSYLDALNEARNTYNSQKSAAEGSFASQMQGAYAGVSEAERGGYSQIKQQYGYLSSLFGNEMAKEAIDWNKKMENNSEAVSNLVSGGVLTVKKGGVLNG